LKENPFIRQKTNSCAVSPTRALNDQVVLQNQYGDEKSGLD
jgi:hypothetical protein